MLRLLLAIAVVLASLSCAHPRLFAGGTGESRSELVEGHAPARRSSRATPTVACTS